MVSEISMVFSVDFFRPGQKLIDIYIYFNIYTSPKINMSTTRGPTISTRHLIFQPLIFMRYGRFQNLGYPKMDGLEWKTLLKWMIWVP